MLAEDLVAKRLCGGQCLGLASIRPIAKSAPPNLVSTLNADDPSKGAVGLTIDPRNAIARTFRGTTGLTDAILAHLQPASAQNLAHTPGFNDIDTRWTPSLWLRASRAAMQSL